MSDQRRLNNIFFDAVIDTCTFAVLFGRLRNPGDLKRPSRNFNAQECIAMEDFAMEKARSKELTTEYRYATAGLIVGCLGGVVVVIGYVFLVMAGHMPLAVGMLGSSLEASATRDIQIQPSRDYAPISQQWMLMRFADKDWQGDDKASRRRHISVH